MSKDDHLCMHKKKMAKFADDLVKAIKKHTMCSAEIEYVFWQLIKVHISREMQEDLLNDTILKALVPEHNVGINIPKHDVGVG